MSKKWIAISLFGGIAVFGGVLGSVYCIKSAKTFFISNAPAPVSSVTAETARTETWPIVVPAVGILRAVNGVDVSTSIADNVAELHFESGQVVKKGDLLVQIDISEELSQLESQKAALRLAEIKQGRASQLVITSAGTKATLDDANAELDKARASVDEITARIAKKTVRAPFDGKLGIRQIDLGEYVSPGQVLVNLQDLSVILADFTVSQRQLSALKAGGELNMTVDTVPGHVFKGKITAVAPLVDNRTGMVKVEGRFDNADQKLRPGMLARLEAVQPSDRQVVTVPNSALTYNLYGDTVFVINPLEKGDGKKPSPSVAAIIGMGLLSLGSSPPRATPLTPDGVVSRVMVQVGERQKDRVVIVSGLKEGQEVVTTGLMKLQDGSLVHLSDMKMDPQPNSAGSGLLTP